MNKEQTVAEMLSEDGEPRGVPRRRILALGVGLLTGAAVVIPASERARAEVSTEELTADGDEITSHDGSIDAIPVDPVIGIAWEGLNDASTDVDVEITFDTDEESPITVYSESETLSGTNGDETFDYQTEDLLDAGWSASTFEATENNSTNTTTVSADVEVTGEDLATSTSDDFTVTVENHPAAVSTGGEITTEIESDEEV